MENKKSYYAVIPASVRYDKRLRPNAKLLYGEITALCNEKGFCWASNSYFAELYEVSIGTVSEWVNQLKKYNYLNIEMIYKENSKEIQHRYIRLLDPIPKKTDAPSPEKSEDPLPKNPKDNITSNNTEIEALPGFRDIVPQPEIIKQEKQNKVSAENKDSGRGGKKESPELLDFKKRMKQNINVACQRYDFDPIYWDAKQNIQFNNLIKRVLFLSAGDMAKARDLFIKMIETFASCRRTDKWWKSKPFTPAAMVGLFDNIMAQKDDE